MSNVKKHTELADWHNRYEIVAAAREAGIEESDPHWSELSDREKWEAILATNHGNFMKRMNPEVVVDSQEQIISKIIGKRPVEDFAEEKKEK